MNLFMSFYVSFGHPVKKSSELISKVLEVGSFTPMKWLKELSRNLNFIEASMRGKIGAPSSIKDPRVRLICIQLLQKFKTKKKGDGHFSVKTIAKSLTKQSRLNEEITKMWPFIENNAFTESMTRRLMASLGWFTSKRNKKKIYHDGHERSDVVSYRNEFLDYLESIDEYIWKLPRPPTQEEKEEIIRSRKTVYLIHYQDETTFFSDKFMSVYWTDGTFQKCQSHRPGVSIMLSGYVNCATGWSSTKNI